MKTTLILLTILAAFRLAAAQDSAAPVTPGAVLFNGSDLEALVPGANKPASSAADDVQGPRTLLSSGFSAGSDGSSFYQGLVEYRATKNLTLFGATQGGSLMAGLNNGQRFGLAPLSTLGFLYDGLDMGGIHGNVNFSFTPAISQGTSFSFSGLGNGGLAASALPGYGGLNWGTDNGYSFGSTLSKEWGAGMSTLLSIQVNHNSPMAFMNAGMVGSPLLWGR